MILFAGTTRERLEDHLRGLSLPKVPRALGERIALPPLSLCACSGGVGGV